MCLGLPGKIIEIKGNSAVVEIMGVTREISIELLKEVKTGEFVLVHAGCAIQVLDEQEARATMEIFEELKEIT